MQVLSYIYKGIVPNLMEINMELALIETVVSTNGAVGPYYTHSLAEKLEEMFEPNDYVTDMFIAGVISAKGIIVIQGLFMLLIA